MDKKNTDIRVIDILKSVYDETNKGIAYAETKNAVLIGFNIALLGVVAGFSNNIDSNLMGLTIVFVGLLVVAAGFALFSFWPLTDQMDNYSVAGDNVISDNDKDSTEKENLLFYKSAVNKRPADYIQCLYYRYQQKDDIEQNAIDHLEMDYAREIVYNAGIAMRKFTCFKKALKIEVIAGIAGLALLGFKLFL